MRQQVMKTSVMNIRIWSLLAAVLMVAGLAGCSESLLDEKMSRAAAILPQLEGMEGVLHLETWSPGTVNIVFSRKTDTETDNFVD